MASRVSLVCVCLALAGSVLIGQTSQTQTPPAQTPPAQTPQEQGVFRRDVQTVAIYATVLDANGRLIPDLEREHFEVLDDGKPQPLTVFRSDVQPVSVVVMLDTSGSMTMNIDLLKLAAEQFVIRLHPKDRARIGSFSDDIRLSPQFTSNRDDMIRILHTDIRYGNPTYLWDAVDLSLDALAKEEGRKVILVFTDGEDMKSVKTDFDQLLARVQNDETMIYAIGLQSNVQGQITRPDRRLRILSSVTGGGYFELTKTSDLGATFTRVADELHRQYVLGFTPAVLDGRPHVLDVRVKVEGMTARARKSYIASRTGGHD